MEEHDGYGADTTFHRAYSLFLAMLLTLILILILVMMLMLLLLLIGDVRQSRVREPTVVYIRSLSVRQIFAAFWLIFEFLC